MNGSVLFASVIIMFFLHELGHYIVAKRLNKFDKWIFSPLYVAVKPTFPLTLSEANFIMWAGILFSLPLGLFISILSGEWVFLFSVFLLGCFDLLWIFIFYNEKKQNPFFNEITSKHGLFFEFKEGHK